ncbi:MAG: protein kinase [Thermoanaerobaculia bacterium]
MSEIFGDYCLLYLVHEDVLGEVHCAARRDQDHEQRVLLMIFDRRNLDASRFLDLVAGREAVARALTSPHLAHSLELGVEDGRPFTVLPYIAGRSLETWIREAVRRRRPFPVDVALRIVGDLGRGLQEAYWKPTGRLKLIHGFLVPQLVMVTTRGDVRLCGLEAAPTLRDFRGPASAVRKVLPYLSPEARLGQEIHSADDVYSLGVLLYEMLTLKPLISVIDLGKAELAPEPVQGDLRRFLERCVAPRFRRLENAVEWLREFKKMVARQDLDATTEDFATFFAALNQGMKPRFETTPIDTREVAKLVEERRRKSDTQEIETLDESELP